jgi:hypothetical protein
MVTEMATTNKALNTQFFRVETLASGVKILWLDVPGKVNILKLAVLHELTICSTGWQMTLP